MTSVHHIDKSPILTPPQGPHNRGISDTDTPSVRATRATRVSFADVDGDANMPPARLRPERKRRLLPSLPAVTLVLPNTGSVARDHLASERTWLSYVRTSLGVASTGVALVQLFTISGDEDDEAMDPHEAKIERFARPLGATTVFVGLSVLAIGVQRYFRVQHALTQGEFPVARVTVFGISGVLAALVAVTFGVLIAVPRN